MSFFDVLNNLTSSKEYTYTQELEADILPFLLNRGMSNFMDCCLHANEMNIRPNVSKKQLYDYYHFAIQPKRKRFAKWAKPEKDETVNLIKTFYKCNIDVAEQYMKILTADDLELIKQKLSKGGRG